MPHINRVHAVGVLHENLVLAAEAARKNLVPVAEAALESLVHVAEVDRESLVLAVEVDHENQVHVAEAAHSIRIDQGRQAVHDIRNLDHVVLVLINRINRNRAVVAHHSTRIRAQKLVVKNVNDKF